MKYKILSFTLLIILFTGFFQMAFSSEIVGYVTDASTDESLPGANVIIEGTFIGASTDLEGFYRITNVEPGTYVLSAIYIGYSKVDTTVQINQGERLEINFTLISQALQTDVIEVTAQLEGQMAAMNQQLSSNTIINVVSKERIRELPDDNAADAVGRLPGIAVSRSGGEAERVTIRGMSPKYNSITVDGERIPATSQGRQLFRFKGAGGGSVSTTTEDRSVDLSVISAEALDGIEVSKALTPDKDADAIGGQVNFVTGKAPEGLKVRLNVLGGYTGYHESFENIKVTGSASNRFLENDLGLLIATSFQRADRSSDEQSGDWLMRGAAPELSGVDLYDRIELRDRYNINFNADYTLGEHSEFIITNMYSETDRDIRTRAFEMSLQSNNGAYNTNWSKPTISVFSSNLRGKHNMDFADIDWGVNFIQTVDQNDFNYGWGFTEEAIFQSTDFVESEGVYAASNHVTFDPDRARGGTPYGGGKSKRDDQNWGIQLNVKKPFSISSNLGGYVKIGGKYRNKDRSSESSGLKGRGANFQSAYQADHPDVLVTQQSLAMSNFNDAYDPGKFFNGDHFFPNTLDYKLPKSLFEDYRYIWKEQIADGLGDYTAGEKITAGYFMSELNIGQDLSFIGGVRYEHVANDYTAVWRTDITEDYFDETRAEIQGLWGDTSSIANNEEWFPQFHLKYNVIEDRNSGSGFDVRLAYTRTISRPDYLLLSPRIWESSTKRVIEKANPDLKPTTAWNYDLFLTGYSRYGMLSVGGFYKDLNNVSFEYYRKANESDGIANWERWNIVNPINSKEDNFVYGFEIELQTNFSYLPSPFNGIVLYGNYTRAKSEVKYPWEFVDETKIVPPLYQPLRVDSSRVNKLPGQADHIANVALGYDYGPFSGRVSFYYQDKILNWLGSTDLIDNWTDEYMRIDFSASYKILDNLTAILNLNNINNRYDKTYYGTRKLTGAESIYGMRAEFGLRYDLF